VSPPRSRDTLSYQPDYEDLMSRPTDGAGPRGCELDLDESADSALCALRESNRSGI